MEIDERYMQKKDAFYAKILGSPSCAYMSTLLRDASDLGLSCAAPYHRLIVAEIELWEELYSRTDKHFDPEKRGEILFVISNLCYELFSVEGCHVDSLDFQGRMVFWIDADTNTVSTYEFQKRAIRTAEILESEYRLFVTFSISEWFSDLFQTFYTYQNTLNVLFYHRYLSGKKSAYSMLDTPTDAVLVSLSQRYQEEKQIVQLLQVGNIEEVRNQVYEIFQKRFYETPPALELIPQRKAAFSELLELIVNEIALRCPNTGTKPELVIRQMASSETGAEQLEILDNFVDTIIQSREDDMEPTPVWLEPLKDYVKKNYQDANLTVYAAAEFVGLTPSYCTRMFRQHTGISLMRYIQRQRVQAAISLLESGCTMVQVAERTGFACTQTLRRTLKQYRA